MKYFYKPTTLVLIISIVFSFSAPVHAQNLSFSNAVARYGSCALSRVTQSIGNALGGLAISTASGISSSISSTVVPVQDENLGDLQAEGNEIAGSISELTGSIVDKEFVQDCIVYQTARYIEEQLVQGTVNWVNTGLGGSPFYVREVTGYLLSYQAAITKKYIEETLTGLVDKAYEDEVLFALEQSQSSVSAAEALRCPNGTINDAFTGGNTDSWLYFIETVQTPGCTPDGAYAIAESSIALQQNIAVTEESKHLEQSPFLPDRDANGIKTPGRIIEEQLIQSLGSSIRQLETADELGDIFDLLINYAFNSLVKGLRDS